MIIIRIISNDNNENKRKKKKKIYPFQIFKLETKNIVSTSYRVIDYQSKPAHDSRLKIQ